MIVYYHQSLLIYSLCPRMFFIKVSLFFKAFSGKPAMKGWINELNVIGWQLGCLTAFGLWFKMTPWCSSTTDELIAATAGGLCLWAEEGAHLQRHPRCSRSIRPANCSITCSWPQTGHGVRCWVILRVGVISWELDAFLKCLGGCLQGMSSYAAAWGAENACTATDQNIPLTTLPTQPQKQLRSV